MRESGERVDCSFGEPSSVAVDPGIAFCSPSAAFAVACWQAGAAHALCATDPSRRILVRYPLSGAFRAPAAPDSAVPYTMTLTDGHACTIRDGGTGPMNLTDHPDWVAYYYCDRATAVFGPRRGTGVDTGSDPWTVHLASTGAEDTVTPVAVRSAILLGTAVG